MELFLIAIVAVGLCVFGMCFNIIFRKDGQFPEYEVGSNKEMRKLGIRCMKEEDWEIHGKTPAVKHSHCTQDYTEECVGCALYKKEEK